MREIWPGTTLEAEDPHPNPLLMEEISNGYPIKEPMKKNAMSECISARLSHVL